MIALTIENEPEPDEPDTPDTPDDPAPDAPADVPKTGDDTELPWLALALSGLGVAAIGTVSAVLYGKKKKK